MPATARAVHVATRLQACFNRGRPDRALAYLALLPATVAPWVAVMKEANRRGDLDTLRRVLAARQAAGLRPDHRTVSATITGVTRLRACCRPASGRQDESVGLDGCSRRQSLPWVAGEGSLSCAVPAAAGAGYAGVGRLQDAMATFCRAWEVRECRTVEVCNAAISACANQGNWAAAQEVRAGNGARQVGGVPCRCQPCGVRLGQRAAAHGIRCRP